MNPDTVDWLHTTQAQELMHLVDPQQHLTSMTRLRAHTTLERAAAVFELVSVRHKALTKFHDGHQLWFTQTGLEQASHERVAQHRAQQFADATHIVDMCCGCGGDLLAFGAHTRTTGIDLDAGRIALAQANLRQRGLTARAQVQVGDVTSHALAADVDAVFFDPGRRQNGRRIMHHDAYQPPLTTATHWMSTQRTVAIKCAPGIDYADLPFAHPYAVECVSYAGDMRETVLWFNHAVPWRRRATVLSDHNTHTITDQQPSTQVAVTAPAEYLYEPDSAVIRAGLVKHLAQSIGASMLDTHIAYLTHTQVIATPLARCWRILTSLPFSERGIQAALASFDAGAITVKKRGSPVDSDQLARRLSRPHGRPLVVVLTRVADVHTALICEGPYLPKEQTDDSST
jgi:hypothetical protein